MAERFDLIVFDWDGTLMDSAGAIVRAMQAATRDLGLAEIPEERARYVIGLGLGDPASAANNQAMIIEGASVLLMLFSARRLGSG